MCGLSSPFSVFSAFQEMVLETCLLIGSSIINKLFINSIPAFDLTNSLYSVLETCGAILVMYHARVTRELGPGNVNVISTTLEDAAREAVLSDHVYPRDAPVNILNR